MTTTVAEPELRASEIPQQPDFDDFIDGLLLRSPGNNVRPLVEVLEPGPEDLFDGIPWEYGGDVYAYVAANEYLPQPPSALASWEAELHGMDVASACPCGCGMQVGPSSWFSRVMADLGRQMSASMDRRLEQIVSQQFLSERLLTDRVGAITYDQVSLQAAMRLAASTRLTSGQAEERLAAARLELTGVWEAQRVWIAELTASMPMVVAIDTNETAPLPSVAAVARARQHRSSGPPVDGVAEARRRHGRRP